MQTVPTNDSTTAAYASLATDADTSTLSDPARLVLTTQGRYSAKAEKTLLTYRRLDNDFIVIASNNNKRFKPGWFLNLKEEPIVQLEVGDAKFYAKAITPTRRARLELLPLINEMVGDTSPKVPRETAAVILSPMC
jgi:deazaflavin-dependent oxidoreductase (nitroreductase family)